VTDSKPTVLFVSHDASRTGAPLCLSELLTGIANDGARFSPFVFVTGDGPLIAEWQKLNLPVVLAQKRVRAGRLRKALSVLRSMASYIRLLRSVRPKLIYSNTIRNGLEVIVGRLLGIRTLVHVHEGERIMRHYARSFRIASLFTSRFVCASRYSAASLEKVVGRNSSVVYSGVKTVDVTDVAVPQIKDDALILGMVGGIQPNKGQHVAVEALSILVADFRLSVRLRLFGEIENSAYKHSLDDRIAALSLGPLVEYCGSLEDRAKIYSGFDVLVLASYDESFGRVLLEALAYAKPVVASNVGGVPEIVRDGENGILVPPGDPSSLAAAIVRLASKPELAARITDAGVYDVQHRFRLEDTLVGLRGVIEEALK